MSGLFNINLSVSIANVVNKVVNDVVVESQQRCKADLKQDNTLIIVDTTGCKPSKDVHIGPVNIDQANEAHYKFKCVLSSFQDAQIQNKMRAELENMLKQQNKSEALWPTSIVSANASYNEQNISQSVVNAMKLSTLQESAASLAQSNSAVIFKGCAEGTITVDSVVAKQRNMATMITDVIMTNVQQSGVLNDLQSFARNSVDQTNASSSIIILVLLAAIAVGVVIWALKSGRLQRLVARHPAARAAGYARLPE